MNHLENPFEGMEELTIMITDNDGHVCCVLDHNGIPISHGKIETAREKDSDNIKSFKFI